MRNEQGMGGERAVRQFGRRLKWACGVRGAAWWFIAALLAWGSVVVVARLLWQPRPELLYAGAAVSVALAIIGGYWGTRKVPREEQLLALLDAENRCGGVLMSGRDLPLDGWAEFVKVEQIPEVVWQKRKAVTLLLVSIVYVAAGLLLPYRYLRLGHASSLVAQRQVNKLHNQMEKLRDLGLLDAERHEELQAELEQVHKNANPLEPEKTHEALDHLAQVLEQLSEQGVQQRLDKRQQIEQAKALAEAAQQMSKAGELTADQRRLVSQALAMSVQNLLASEQSSQLPEKAVKELLSQHEAGEPFTDEELARLAELLGDGLDALQLDWDALADLEVIDPERLERIKNVRFIDAELVAKCLGECDGDCDAEELLAILGQCQGGNSPAENNSPRNNMTPHEAGVPGRGGVDRGRADAPIVFGQPSSAEGVQFRPEAIPPSAVRDLQAKVLQVRRVPPTTEARETSAGGVLTNVVGVGEGHERQILPRHRASVRKYFQSER